MVTRREFFQTVGTTVAMAGLPVSEALAQASPSPSSLPEPPASPFPGLNRRTLGWLRFLWEKSTTLDDWSSAGVPHPWWDRYTAPVVLSYGRFDLSFSAYGLLMMADQTPAWREVYTRITDEMARRYPTYWGAIDWLTQIGDDPKRAKYPASIMATLPPNLRGNYNRFGWTANGIQPWGLQRDPVGADGYLFFRGWFHLLLATYKYISGDDKWARPFKVTGYADEEFEWDHHRLAARLEEQYRQRPEGPHCENTKIWFYCNSAAALGMYLYDKVYGRQTHLPTQNFLDYARQNYMGVSKDGKLEWVTNYYDPLVGFKFNGPPASGLNVAFMVLPQNRELAAQLYDAAANAAGWRAPNAQVRANSNGLLLARELGDTLVAERLAAAAERESEPRFFGPRNEMFGWWFRLNEGFPRGQQSATLMVSEIGRGGDWARAFEVPHMDKFEAPTVEGVDFPSLGVYQAWNDPASGTLNVGTYAAAPDRRGAQTKWNVTKLPDSKAVKITADGQPFTRFEVTGPDSIRIDSTVDNHQFRIVTGYRGAQGRADEQLRPRRAGSLARASRPPAAAAAGLFSVKGAGCPCCQG
ncbi:MAG TPA: hypothetical protein VEF06_09025 [Bryobacteraceae bacterium]|nr:hypothetical protein [Bryobacteraceae bacterium]